MSHVDAPGNRVVRKIRIRAVLFLATALIAGTAAVFLVKVFLDQAQRRSTVALETVVVVVAEKDMQGGQRLDRAQLALVNWPAAHVPAGTFQDAGDVVGQTLRQDVVSGEPILRDRLASKDKGQGLAALLDAGSRAMAVKVDQVVGVAGFVQPNDRVDVLTTIATDDESRAVMASKAAKISKIILQDIRVLAVGEHLATDGHKPVKVQVVTLQVQPEQSERLALASQYGTIQLTMRSRVDRATVETPGVTPLGLLATANDADVYRAREAAATSASSTTTVASKKDPPVTLGRRPNRTRAPVAKPLASAPPPEKRDPVVEILRGTDKIEERKIKQTGGLP